MCARSVIDIIQNCVCASFLAGIMATPYHETGDGFEEQWQINYLSHFLLTSLLLPLLNAGGRPNDYTRIINVASCTHFAGTLHLDDVNRKYENLKNILSRYFLCLLISKSCFKNCFTVIRLHFHRYNYFIITGTLIYQKRGMHRVNWHK